MIESYKPHTSSKNMKTPSFSYFVLFASLQALTFTFLPDGVNGAYSLENHCRKLAIISQDRSLSYKFCMSALQADPRSKTADLQQLGVISMDLIQANATYIKSYVQTLISDPQKGGKLAVKLSLEGCLRSYDVALYGITMVKNRLSRKFYAGSNVLMNVVDKAPINCEAGFMKGMLISPLTKENSDFKQLASIPERIIDLLR